MPLISIVTAAWSGTITPEHLRVCADSVCRQQLPHGWRLEWIVQEDGDSPSLTPELIDVPVADYRALGAHLGVAITRNLALSRCRGEFVQVLDADDVLMPDALARMVHAFDDPTIHWAVGQADDLMPDGSRIAFPAALPYGRVAAGAVNRWSRDHEGAWPIHPAGLMVRTTTLRAIGGWYALPHGEDIAMLTALTEMADGWHQPPPVTWLYRQHDRQVTRTSPWRHDVELGCRLIALQREQAVRSVRMAVGTAGVPTHIPRPGPAILKPPLPASAT